MGYVPPLLERHQCDTDLLQPSIGITRSKRWRRAHQLKLNPPIEVLAVLLKGKDTKQDAYIDVLLS
jgi:DNA polymerase delta subunit 4